MTNTYYTNPAIDRFYEGVHKFNTLAIIIGTFLFFLSIPIVGGYFDTHYTTTATVWEVGDDYTLLVDGAGYVWEVTDTNYRQGQFVEIEFFNNTTDYTRDDDEILKVKVLDN